MRLTTNRTRLNLETLEDRSVPATLTGSGKGAVSILFPVFKPTTTPAAVAPAEPVINKVGILIGLLRPKQDISVAPTEPVVNNGKGAQVSILIGLLRPNPNGPGDNPGVTPPGDGGTFVGDHAILLPAL